MKSKAKNGTSPSKPKRKAGTNAYDFDEDKIETLASKFWSVSEIAAFYNVDEGTIRKRFPNLITKGREKGKAKLRDLQMAAASKGSVGMLVWLGKQYLNQREPEDVKQDLPELPEFDNFTEEELDAFIKRHQN